MTITAGGYAFDEERTTVRETYEVLGGKETRLIAITGLIRGAGNRVELDGALDDLLRAVSEAGPVYVSVRSGRRILARREEFTREVHSRHLTGKFTVTFRAETAWEESIAEESRAWNISQSGEDRDLAVAGNRETLPVIALTATDDIVGAAFSDGTRALAYEGVIEAGSSVLIDGPAGKVWLDGEEITPYMEGDFPRLQPGAATLTFTDGPSSSHLMTGTVSWRARWW